MRVNVDPVALAGRPAAEELALNRGPAIAGDAEILGFKASLACGLRVSPRAHEGNRRDRVTCLVMHDCVDRETPAVQPLDCRSRPDSQNAWTEGRGQVNGMGRTRALG